MTTIKTILFPTDFSPNSAEAFVWACSLARDNKARLLILHVIPADVDPMVKKPTPDRRRPAESQEPWKEGFAWPQPSDPSIVVEHRLAEGYASEEILRLAQEEKCDIIVLGTHGRTGLRRLLTGSVAEEVLRKATCPVLALRTPEPETQPERAATVPKPR